jgi:hypothetical protein
VAGVAHGAHTHTHTHTGHTHTHTHTRARARVRTGSRTVPPCSLAASSGTDQAEGLNLVQRLHDLIVKQGRKHFTDAGVDIPRSLQPAATSGKRKRQQRATDQRATGIKPLKTSTFEALAKVLKSNKAAALVFDDGLCHAFRTGCNEDTEVATAVASPVAITVTVPEGCTAGFILQKNKVKGWPTGNAIHGAGLCAAVCRLCL